MSRKTTFAGLMVLEPDESVVEDGGAFIGRDRDTIDRYLEIGAKTHRHTGLSGIGNPVGAPSAAVVNSGGTIPGDLALTIGYTSQDDQRGETLLSPTVAVSTPGPLDPPEDAPSAEMDYAAGSLTQDTYYYGETYVDSDGGETPLGPTTGVTREPGFPNAQVLLSGLATGLATASAAAWRLYRARGGGDFAYLASGTADTYTDDGTISPVCDAQPPQDENNSTNSINSLLIDIPADVPEGTSFINVYLSESGDFSGGVFLEQFPVSSAGQSVLYRSIELQDAQPPDVSTSIGGANQIDPDTELLDWHWKRPVATRPDLPTGLLGDVRLVESSGTFWGMLLPSGDTDDWQQLGGNSSPRQWASASASAVASGGSANIDLDLDIAGMRLLKISTSKRSRVRIYGDAESRTADAARGIGTDPTGDHGVLLDYAMTAHASGGIGRLSPAVDAHNLDDPAMNKFYINVTNFDATGNVVAAVLYIPTEVV